MSHPHVTSSLIMCRPTSFGFNTQTGADNEFQHKPKANAQAVTQLALAEFDAAVTELESKGLTISILEHAAETELPDAVFPNNWFTTHPDGQLVLYSMKTPNRQQEVCPDKLTRLLHTSGFQFQSITPMDRICNGTLEGTGAMVFDHLNKLVYAALSERCEHKSLLAVSDFLDYSPIAFEALSQHDQPIYHTNVMMSVGKQFAVVCQQSITSDSKQLVLNELLASNKKLIDISFEQCESHFCANIIEVINIKGDPLILMSESAYKGFTLSQRRQLEQFGEPVICSIPTIEQVGGGSLRCMLAENFLPKQ
ncbi:arginine deiminase-related protein [Pleionea litopenaei]|uniref:Arginine deiminase-related protein n=1 Tax=Pleionea litopenaei TaxID=3070815 RepID=A0AA51RST0_9GAMM|nr:arginine deiminase-related protein [Pleionea sp. HL-JVS1]WMS86912.1 arginine deiminase-related protein [Pleionea sp. HL-JVS1]